MRIDSHQHFWKYDPQSFDWITEEMNVLRQDFLPPDLFPLLGENKIDACVTVQAAQSEQETDFLLQLASEHSFIKGVVGWVDLMAGDIEERLAHFSQYKILKGFRHIVQSEPQLDFLLREDFGNGIGKLSKYGFTYDLLIYPKQLPAALQFVKKYPDLKIVIDHIAKPGIKQNNLEEWASGIKAIARHEHVYCKVSGLVTEAEWQNWKTGDFTYCLDLVTESFGMDRLLFGSDWPVCLLAATYPETCRLVHDYYSRFTENEQKKIWGTNAIAFYNL